MSILDIGIESLLSIMGVHIKLHPNIGQNNHICTGYDLPGADTLYICNNSWWVEMLLCNHNGQWGRALIWSNRLNGTRIDIKARFDSIYFDIDWFSMMVNQHLISLCAKHLKPSERKRSKMSKQCNHTFMTQMRDNVE